MIAGRRPDKSISAVPVLSFVKAPYPKPRPLFTGGIPVNIEAFIQPALIIQPTVLVQSTAAFEPTFDTSEPIEQRIQNAIITRSRLEPLSPAITQSLKDRFIISSYAAGLRIDTAHKAARQVINQKFDLSQQFRWKTVLFKRDW